MSAQDAGGIDITVYGKGNDSGLAIPGRVFIEGREVFVPEGTEIDLSTLSNSEVPTVTLTMFVRNFTITNDPPPSDA